jgi:hypothetical protein
MLKTIDKYEISSVQHQVSFNFQRKSSVLEFSLLISKQASLFSFFLTPFDPGTCVVQRMEIEVVTPGKLV